MIILRKALLPALSKIFSAYKSRSQERRKLRHNQKTEVAKATALVHNTSKALEKQTKRDKKQELKLAKIHHAQKNKTASAILQDKEKARSHELKLAKQKIEQLKAGKFFNISRITRFITVAKLVAPFLVPLIYRISIALRHKFDSLQSQHEGLAFIPQSGFSRSGAQLNLRINKANTSLEQIAKNRPGNLQVKQFTTNARQKLADLATAVANAESFPKARQKEAQNSIDSQLVRIEDTILTELGALN